MRVWAHGGAALLVAAVTCVLSGALLSVTLPAPVTAPRPGPVLETVTPAQLAAMNVRLDAAVQPVVLPDWLTGVGVSLPASILLPRDAESSVRQSSGGVRAVIERVLTYATIKARVGRPRGPTVAHRLVWAVVGTRSTAGNPTGLLEVLWLVDAHSGHQLAELSVPAPLAGGGTGAGGSGP